VWIGCSSDSSRLEVGGGALPVAQLTKVSLPTTSSPSSWASVLGSERSKFGVGVGSEAASVLALSSSG
jgi:hypothetical protein